jgi:exo-beta-1,3-glucanase (GH17 family)
MKKSPALLAWALALVAVVVVAACGGGGTVPSTGVQLRPLSADFQRKAIDYGPYRTARNNADLVNEQIPKANLKQDMDLLVAAGFGLVRIFDSSDKVARQTLEVIRENAIPIKMQLGMYVATGDNEAFNQQELARGIALANEFSDIVVGVSVGNETMVSWSFNPIPVDIMIRYITQVRNAVTQPVTTNDNYALFAGSDRRLVDALDYVSMHTYPLLDTVFDPDLWDWRVAHVPEAQRASAMVDAAIDEAKRQYKLVRDRLDSSGLTQLPIVIGETGWKAVDTNNDLKFRASPVNQKMYYDRLQTWVASTRNRGGPLNVFYFVAFDEPWKLGDDGWGLWNVNREARYTIKDLNPPSATWRIEAASANLTDDDAVYFVPPTVNPAVTQDRYVIFSETTTASDFVPTGLRWDAFDGTTAVLTPVADPAPGDGSQSFRISPVPKDFGWGLLYQSADAVTANLSGFANGRVEFSIRTTYAQKLEIGISTETELEGAREAFLQLSNGDFGYCNTGQWCKVSIPVQAFVDANPKLDLRLVLGRFFIADRFGVTGNAQKNNLPNLFIDGVVWTR